MKTYNIPALTIVDVNIADCILNATATPESVAAKSLNNYNGGTQFSRSRSSIAEDEF